MRTSTDKQDGSQQGSIHSQGGDVPAPAMSIETTSNGAPKAALTWTAEEERTLVKKLDWNLMPLLWVLFMLSFLDRSNIGNANTAGMSKDLGMDGDQYQWLLTIFYIGYALGQPTMLLWKAVPPHILVAVLTFCWGAFALLQPTARWGGLMALRLLLGVAETAFSPGVTFFLSFFYGRREVGLRQGCGYFAADTGSDDNRILTFPSSPASSLCSPHFILLNSTFSSLYAGAAPVASAYAGALAYGITQIRHSSIATWKLLFLIEGAPAILAVPLAYFFLADRPSKARFLTEREKEIAVARAERDGRTGREGGLKSKGVWAGLKDPKAYFCALVYFSCNVSYSSLPVFLPTILADMGFSSIRAQGLSAPPYLASFLVIITCCYLSDRIGDRSIFMIPLALIGGIGYIILATVESTGVRYFAIYLCACGIFPVIGLMLPFTASMHEDDSRRGAGFLILNLIGQCGPFLGTRMYPSSDKPYYVKGMAVSAAFMFFAAFLIASLRLILMYQNRRLDARYGFVDPKASYHSAYGFAAGRGATYDEQQMKGAAEVEEEQVEREERRRGREEGENPEWRFLL
ncbi:hypothetical protein JCM11251_005240 [Rhodosporidiobolus azoricus]